MTHLKRLPSIGGVYDAPLISPENKNSSSDIIAGLPKVALDVRFAPRELPADPAQLSAALRAKVEALREAAVVYAEILFDPQAYGCGAEAALEAAGAALEVPGIDARLLLTSAPQAALARAGAKVAGYAFCAGDGVDPAVAEQLRANYVPFTVDVAGAPFEAIDAAVQAGAVRLAQADQLVEDFTADLEGIVPGTVSGWVRDRRLGVVLDPPLDPEQLADHPLPLLQQLGFSCAVPGAGETFRALEEVFGYGLDEFFDLTVKAVEAAFCSQEDRQRLLEELILPAYERLSDPELSPAHAHPEEAAGGAE